MSRAIHDRSVRAGDGPVGVARILVVDDDAPITTLLDEYLCRAGYAVDTAGDGRVALRKLFAARPDLVILDVGLPGLSGWEVLERIRDLSDVPVLMLTARDRELDKVRGLRAGADDYVTKPFGRQELLARVAALLRRAPVRTVPASYRDELVAIDFSQCRVTVAGAEAALTPREFALLAAFVAHPDQVLTRDQLFELAWRRGDEVDHGQVKIHVGHLRRKLAAHATVELVETVRGFGYRYRPGGATR